MSDKVKIIFFNYFNIGDTYFAQPFVKNIIDNNGDVFEYYIMSKFNYFIYQSIIPDINIIINHNHFLNENNIYISVEDLNYYDYFYFKEQNIIFINTWIGNYLYSHCHNKEHFLTYYKESVNECDPVSYIKSYQITLKILLEKENIKINYNNDPLLAIPTFPPNLDINHFINFKKNSDKKIVFFNNYYACSGQPLSMCNISDRICIINYFIQKNYIVLLSEYEHDLQIYKEQNNLTDLYFAPLIFDMVINTSCYNVYFYAKIAHNSDIALYFDTGKNFTYINEEFINEYNNNVNRNTKIHIGVNNYFFKNLSNPIYFPEGYVKFIEANGGSDIIEKIEKSNYL